MLGDLLDQNRIAQIGLVGAVFPQGFGERNPRPVFGHGFALGKILEHAGDDRLHRREHVVLCDKTHLDVELVELAGQPVGTRVLVAETRRDLEVTIEARHHQQLLVLLRRLRQRIELARMDPRRHQEVAGPLRRRSRQDRRLKFEESLILHALAHGIDDRAAGHDILVQLFAAKVEETVLKPYVFRIFLLTEHRQRQLACRSQHLDFADIEFDRAGRQVRIFGAGGTAAQLAVDPHHPFRAQLFGVLEGRRIRIGNALRQPIMVAQIDEQHPTMVANTMAPAGQTNALADIALTERAAGVGPVTMHGYSRNKCRRGRIGGRSLPEEVEGLPEAFRRGNRMRAETAPSHGAGKAEKRHQGTGPCVPAAANRLSNPHACLS